MHWGERYCGAFEINNFFGALSLVCKAHLFKSLERACALFARSRDLRLGSLERRNMYNVRWYEGPKG